MSKRIALVTGGGRGIGANDLLARIDDIRENDQIAIRVRR